MADWIPINLNAIFPPVDSEIQIQQIQQNLVGWPGTLALNKHFCDFLKILANRMSAAGNGPYISNTVFPRLGSPLFSAPPPPTFFHLRGWIAIVSWEDIIPKYQKTP